MGLHKDSRVITKIQPKIRIIHIFAPEIIKTDVANFRELVQRLTGKPTSQNAGRGKVKPPAKACRTEEPRGNTTVCETTAASIKHDHDRDQVLWKGESAGGFLNALSDVDCFIGEIGDFPFVSLESNAAAAAAPPPPPRFNAFEDAMLSFRG
ncbi:hypothetical protein Nepgr_031192 [Nepenthes gracilis]|uniref:VQ domain-containing protein n=1 Tax=Nepenthes gracilis TaxID=150966 RepID=A0AAD3THM4_NEPGR|nr:hypothetical protein Nepgr_031192 [Nepenthes gracilis]